MIRIVNAEFAKAKLPEILEKLCNEGYKPLEKLCAIADKQADKLNDLEAQNTKSPYTTLCKKLTKEVIEYLTARRDVYIPYIKMLTERMDANHNCSNCAITPEAGNMQLAELQASHKKIKNILYHLQMVSLPLYSETIYPDDYRLLRNQMALVENSLAELFFLEEQYLIPKVIEVQDNTNACSK